MVFQFEAVNQDRLQRKPKNSMSIPWLGAAVPLEASSRSGRCGPTAAISSNPRSHSQDSPAVNQLIRLQAGSCEDLPARSFEIHRFGGRRRAQICSTGCDFKFAGISGKLVVTPGALSAWLSVHTVYDENGRRNLALVQLQHQLFVTGIEDRDRLRAGQQRSGPFPAVRSAS